MVGLLKNRGWFLVYLVVQSSTRAIYFPKRTPMPVVLWGVFKEFRWNAIHDLDPPARCQLLQTILVGRVAAQRLHHMGYGPRPRCAACRSRGHWNSRSKVDQLPAGKMSLWESPRRSQAVKSPKHQARKEEKHQKHQLCFCIVFSSVSSNKGFCGSGRLARDERSRVRPPGWWRLRRHPLRRRRLSRPRRRRRRRNFGAFGVSGVAPLRSRFCHVLCFFSFFLFFFFFWGGGAFFCFPLFFLGWEGGGGEKGRGASFFFFERLCLWKPLVPFLLFFFFFLGGGTFLLLVSSRIVHADSSLKMWLPSFELVVLSGLGILHK